MRPTMRLVELTIRNFRGFGATSDTIKLDRDLILIYGPNGFGKTSIAEAVEWLFYSFTKRRVLGRVQQGRVCRHARQRAQWQTQCKSMPKSRSVGKSSIS